MKSSKIPSQEPLNALWSANSAENILVSAKKKRKTRKSGIGAALILRMTNQHDTNISELAYNENGSISTPQGLKRSNQCSAFIQ